MGGEFSQKHSTPSCSSTYQWMWWEIFESSFIIGSYIYQFYMNLQVPLGTYQNPHVILGETTHKNPLGSQPHPTLWIQSIKSHLGFPHGRWANITVFFPGSGLGTSICRDTTNIQQIQTHNNCWQLIFKHTTSITGSLGFNLTYHNFQCLAFEILMRLSLQGTCKCGTCGCRQRPFFVSGGGRHHWGVRYWLTA